MQLEQILISVTATRYLLLTNYKLECNLEIMSNF